MDNEKQDEDVEAAPSITRKNLIMPNLPKQLSLEEKKYLLAIERGDLPNVRRFLQKANRKKTFDINCVDSLGRGALTIAIDQESLEMVELLVVMGVLTKDALLHAINVEFVEAVELLLEHEELIHKDGEPYSWQRVDINTAMFTPDITPLILAAHRNNYEILKILLDRGAAIPMPHDIKCGCDDCIKQSEEDSLRHSLSRLNEYRALASPSLIALSSSDPLLTAFQLSWELRNLAFAEPECKQDYMELRSQCQQFAVDLLHQSRSSQELAIILNHDPDNPPYEEGEHMKLARLELAIQYKQKKFVSHPNIQQLLAALWYEGVPGFRRKSTAQKVMITFKVALLFPMYCTLYMLAPETKTGKLMRKPFMKFLIHASSYLFFLFLLILVSLRAEDLFFEYFGSESMKAYVLEKYEKQRGNTPTFLEYAVCVYVVGFIVEETQEIFTEGMRSYLRNLWNFIDFTRNLFYTLTFVLRVIAYIQQTNEIRSDPATAYIRREQWNAFDPQLIAEGLFAAANIFSALKLVHLFSINPHLGPLQISLGRMVIDIVKFFFIYSLVLFAFACGLNQLLWYFSDLEKQKCYHLPNGEPDFDNAGDSCMKWRRFANVFESSQTLFWASFGMVDLNSFELTGIRTYTRFWGLLMFGSYSVINVIVLLNLLIAMMSNSYAMIEEHSDTEWKFARTKLWLSYFEESGTLPPPFNIFPKPKHLLKLLGLRKKDKMKRMSTKRRNREEKERDYRYTAVMRALVWRYVSAMHRKCDENEVTEDDINELKSDINGFRYELMDVLGKNGMDTSSVEKREKAVFGKRMKVWERRLMKDFKVAPVAMEENEDLFAPAPEGEPSLARFRRVAKLAALDSNLNKWKQVVKGAQIASQIGRCHTRDSLKKQQNLQKAMTEAMRLAAKTPEQGSRSITPVYLPDYSGSDLVNLVKENGQRSAEPPGKKRVTLSPSAATSGKPQPLSPSISIIPPPKSPAHSPTPAKLFNFSTSSTGKDAPDLINLESPVASLKQDTSSSQSFCDGLDTTDAVERDVFSTPEGTGSSPVGSLNRGPSPRLASSSPRPQLLPPAETEKFRCTPPPQSSLKMSVSPSKSRKSHSPSPSVKSGDREETEICSPSPYTSIDLNKTTVSALRLKFETDSADDIKKDDDPTEEKYRTSSSGEESEDKESCDELERIMDSSKDSEDKKSDEELVDDDINRDLITKPAVPPRKSPSPSAGKYKKSPSIIRTSASPVMGQENSDDNFRLEVEGQYAINAVTAERQPSELQEPPHTIVRPLTPQPESPPRVPTPLRQRNIERVSGRSQPKYGWL